MTAPRAHAVVQSAEEGILAAAHAPDGQLLATASERVIAIWESATSGKMRRLALPEPLSAPRLAWEAPERLVAWGEDGPTYVVDVATGTVTREASPVLRNRVRFGRGVARWFGIVPHGGSFAVLDGDGRLLDALPLPERVNGRFALAASADGSVLAAVASDGTLRRWEGTESGFRAVEPDVTLGAFDDWRVAVGSSVDAVVAYVEGKDAAHPVTRAGVRPACRLLDAAEGPGLAEVAVSPDGAWLFGATSRRWWSGMVAGRRADTCAPAWVVEGRGPLAPSPDGRHLLVVDDDAPALRTVDAGRELARLGSPVRPPTAALWLSSSELVIGAHQGIAGIDLARARIATAREVSKVGWRLGTSQGRLVTLGRLDVASGATCPEGGAPWAFGAWRTPEDPPRLEERARETWPPPPGSAALVCLQGEPLAFDFDRGRVLVREIVGLMPVTSRLRLLDRVRGLEFPLRGSTHDDTGRGSEGAVLSADGALVVLRGQFVEAGEGASGRDELRAFRTTDGEPVESLGVPVDRVPGRDVREFEFSNLGGRSFALAPEGTSALVRRDDGRVSLVELPSGVTRSVLDLHEWPSAHVVGQGGDLVVTFDRGVLTAHRRGTPTWRVATGDAALSVLRLAPDARRLSAVGDDGGTRIFDVADGTLLASGYYFRETGFSSGEWLLVTPGGAFSGPPEAAEHLGWVFESPLERFGFEHTAKASFDPALVARRLGGERVDRSSAPPRPPRVRFAAPPPRSTRADSLAIEIEVASPEGVESVRAVVEGRPVASERVCSTEARVALDVPLVVGDNRINVVAFDRSGRASNPAWHDVVRQGHGASPDLWVVAVGVGRYPRLPADAQLEAADDDARGLAAALARFGGEGYRAVHATTLVDDAATPARIRAALDGLARMAPDDVAVLFFAGHGFRRGDDEMVLLLGGADPAEPSTLSDAIAWSDVAGALKRAKGRVVVLLDACHSGHFGRAFPAANDALAAALVEREHAGALVFAAAKGRQPSFEPTAARGLHLVVPGPANAPSGASHGFFTAALLAALDDPAADRNQDGALQLSELVRDVSVRVSEASRGRQTPWVARRDLFGDFRVTPAARRRAARPSAP